MANRAWWQKPVLRTDEEFSQHRAVTWLELFFDLVFVVVISRLAHNLVTSINTSGVLTFVFMFISVWWVWNSATFYAERFESDGLENRFYTFLTMIPVAGMAIYSDHGLSEKYVGFALSYWLARIINMAMWARAGKHVPEFRPVGNRFILFFLCGVTPLIAFSFMVQQPWRLVLWGAAVLLDIISPYFTMKQQAVLPRLSTSKFPERFGLLTIIVLGEALVGVINGLSEQPKLSIVDGIDGILGILIVIGMWWIYFDFIARRAAKASIYLGLLWVYLHLLLMTTITMSGVGISVAIADADQGRLTEPTRLLLSLGIGAVLIFLGGLETTLHRRENEPTHPWLSPLMKIVGGVVVLLIGWYAESIGTITLFLVIVAALAVQQIYGILVWFVHKLPETIHHTGS